MDEQKRQRGRPKGAKDKAPRNTEHYGPPRGNALCAKGEVAVGKPKDEKKRIVAELVKESLMTFNLPRVQSADELAERLTWYFNSCAEHGYRPVVEQMWACTGYPISQVRDWEREKVRCPFGPEATQTLKNARGFMQVFDAKAVASGNMNPVTYIFRAKNFYGMRDTTDITLAPSTDPLGDEPDARRLSRDYLATLPDADEPATIEVDAVEVEPESEG